MKGSRTPQSHHGRCLLWTTSTRDSSQVIRSGTLERRAKPAHMWRQHHIKICCTSSFIYIWNPGMPSTLTTWTVMQAFMNIYVAFKAEVLFASWASNLKAGLVSCVICSENKCKIGRRSHLLHRPGTETENKGKIYIWHQGITWIYVWEARFCLWF